jgi:hypothetical protein
MKKLVLGLLLCRLIVVPSSFADEIPLESPGEVSKHSESISDGASGAALVPMGAGTNVAIDNSLYRRAPGTVEAVSPDTIGDDLLSLSGPGLAVVVVVSLLILAAVNTRKRPLRANRSVIQSDR